MADFVSQIMDFVFQNIWWFVLIGGVIFFFWTFTSLKGKLKIIKRADIEKQEFLKRLKYNNSNIFKWLKVGDAYVGRIEKLRFVSLAEGKLNEIKEENPKPSNIKVKFLKKWGSNEIGDTQTFDKDDEVIPLLNEILIRTGIAEIEKEKDDSAIVIAQMSMKPVFLSGLKIENFFSSDQPFQIAINDGVKLDEKEGEIILPQGTALDFHIGINYDMSTMKHLNLINEQLLRTDFNLMTSAYFVKSQEMSTFNPEMAHDMAMKERELEIELAKRRGKMSTI